jgi:hypothetical protein
VIRLIVVRGSRSLQAACGGELHISIPLNLKVEATKSQRRNADCCRYQTVGTVTHEEAILRELNAMIANKTIKFGKSP